MRRLLCIGLSRLLAILIRAPLAGPPEGEDGAGGVPDQDDLSVW